VQAKIIKLVGLKNGGRLSPINLVTFAGTQNGEYQILQVEFLPMAEKVRNTRVNLPQLHSFQLKYWSVLETLSCL
jgi:hypothetical protein